MTAAQTVPPPIYWARFETPNFVFDAFGVTEGHARLRLAECWKTHALQYDTSPTYIDEHSEEIVLTPVHVGLGYRDGEPLPR